MPNGWFHKPHLHTPSAHTEHKVARLELFYDLIYVATIIQLGNALSHHVGLGGVLVFFALFVPLWYTWTGFTFYSNRFMVDDGLHRGRVFIQMFAVDAMAVSVPRVMEHDYALCGWPPRGSRPRTCTTTRPRRKRSCGPRPMPDEPAS